ncbi:hypothetical protein JKI95_04190 [Corynebacterium aquatimens]|uniref:hypothetical protein n=2 Tax=Corynebacterium TaxID=1716 RepID=UPI0025417CA0|nr:hypothetical protein [Corynebacterium aquatimens]QYH20164.1 hypothetical protein JKI95_04190 [Corynebacterium aquatimens]
MVVDDIQDPEDFAATRTPDHTAVKVRMVEDAELDHSAETGRTVLPVPMFPEGTLETRCRSYAFTRDMVIQFRFRTDREAFHLLHKLDEAFLVYTSERRGSTPLDFYTELAYAKQLCSLSRTVRFEEDGVYRRNIIDELYPSLIVMSLFDVQYAMPMYFTQLAETKNEDMTSQTAMHLVHAVEAWLPRDIQEYIPDQWSEELNDQLPEPLVDGLNALPGAHFIGVLDTQTQEAFDAKGLPDKDLLSPIPIGVEIEADILRAHNLQIFRCWI